MREGSYLRIPLFVGCFQMGLLLLREVYELIEGFDKREENKGSSVNIIVGGWSSWVTSLNDARP